MRIFQSIETHRWSRIGKDELRPHIPFREEMIHRLVFDPGGKSFIQPEIVPPRHSDEIPKPHMGDLMRDDDRHSLLRRGRRMRRIDQQGDFSISNRPPVLHRSCGKIRNGDQIELG